ncbi:MAG: efflux RND transporter permease subunit [Bdellovibrionales bacterium]|nr:efflux RND transporter permease subunit [Bdellovibrionales bacterium]
MINRLIEFSLKNRIAVLILAAAMVVYGIKVSTELPVDVFPDLGRPYVPIFTEAHGLAPEEVESQITFPIETVMNGATGVERVRSASSTGFSIVWVEFDWKMDIFTARQIVAERLAQVKEILPAEISPVMGPISSIMGEIMLLGVTADAVEIDPMTIRDFAEWTLRPRLLSIQGVSQVSVIGGDLRQYQVKVDSDKMLKFGVSLADVEKAISLATKNTTGGFISNGHTESLIRNIGLIKSTEDIKKAVIPHHNSKEMHAPSLLVEQLAEVEFGGPLGKRGDAGINGHSAVVLSVMKQPGSDTVEISEKINREIKALGTSMPAGMKIESRIFRQGEFIKTSVSNVKDVLRDGAILIIIILFLFLLNIRTTLITLTAIPLSIISSIIVFRYFGLSINTMTLGGLAIAIGELVDDAIVDVENIYRRLRENASSSEPRHVMDVIVDASKEIRSSIVYATAIVVLVFLPLFALSGIEGRLFTPIGIAYVTSISASLIVAVSVTPVLSYYLLPSLKRLQDTKDSNLVVWLKKVQSSLLDVAFKFTRPVLASVLGLFMVVILISFSFGSEFLPPFNEGTFNISLMMPPGTSLKESNRVAVIAEKLLIEMPEIEIVGRRTGRAELDEHASGVHQTELEGELLETDRSRDEILREIRQKLNSIPGVLVNVGQPLSHRIDHVISGVRSQIAVKIFGENLRQLQSLAQKIKNIAADVPGIVDLYVEKQVMIPQLHIKINRERAAQYGVMVGELAEYIEMATQGKVVTQILDGVKKYDVVVRLRDEDRENIDAIKRIPVDVGRGELIPLDLLVNIQEGKGPNEINRENVSRRIYVSANVQGRDLVSTVKELQSRVGKDVKIPEGYFITYGGQFESQSSASRLIYLTSIFSLIAMFALLYMHFQNSSFVLQVMLSIPFAMIGAVIAVGLTGAVFSIASLVGLITLAGIAARNGILMIDHYIHLLEKDGEEFSLQLIKRGASERLVPVLMTALTAMLALIPILISGDDPGKEILYPVAVVIFGGLFTSTLLNLVITPLVFWKLWKR